MDRPHVSALRILTAADLAIPAIVRAALDCAHAATDPADTTAAIPSILAFADRQTDPRARAVLLAIARAYAAIALSEVHPAPAPEVQP